MFGQKALMTGAVEGPSEGQEGTCYIVIKGLWLQAEGTGFP